MQLELVNFNTFNKTQRKIKRIVIIGDAGSGKTTLSYILSKKKGYKLINLDYYREKTRANKAKRKNPLAREESRRKLQQIVKKFTKDEQWII